MFKRAAVKYRSSGRVGNSSIARAGAAEIQSVYAPTNHKYETQLGANTAKLMGKAGKVSQRDVFAMARAAKFWGRQLTLTQELRRHAGKLSNVFAGIMQSDQQALTASRNADAVGLGLILKEDDAQFAHSMKTGVIQAQLQGGKDAASVHSRLYGS